MPLPVDYPQLLAAVDRWNAGVRNHYPRVIPCHPGCSACCHGPFDISVADALMVRDAARALPTAERRALRERAEGQVARMRSLDDAFHPPYDVSGIDEDRLDVLIEALADEPCPALDEAGRCLIYESRPMVCRLMGVGIETPDGEVMENPCPIQDEFPAYRELGPQPCDLDLWGEGEALAEGQASVILFGVSSRADFETTVAGAILLGTA